MLRTILSFLFIAVSVLSSAPVFANEAAEVVCAEQSNADAVTQLTGTQLTSNVNAQIACSSDYDCGYGNICDYGQCRPAQCWSDNQCMPWESCERGRCERDPWANHCQKDSDCFGARICRGGYCKKW